MKYFEILDEKEVEAIHENALRLLKEVGVIFNHDPAVEILKNAGCRADGQKVFFEKRLAEFEKKGFLSPQDELEVLTVKKMKLAGKDQMERLVASASN